MHGLRTNEVSVSTKAISSGINLLRGRMKIFISSLIVGMETLRAAARAAVTALGHEPVMAEDLFAQPNSPQIACLQSVRTADLVVMLFGEHYGIVQGSSGVSPTHEEFLEARDKKPILVFVQEGVTRDPKQSAFLTDVQSWQGGYFRAGFKDANALQTLVTRAVHEYQLSNAAAPLDIELLTKKAVAILQKSQRKSSSSSPMLNVAIAGGPVQQILRPAELESSKLVDALNQQALFGEHRLFSQTSGVKNDVDGTALFLEQEKGARIQVDEQGTLLFRQTLERPATQGSYGAFAIIEETVVSKLNAVLGYAAFLLDHIDSTQRITHVGIAAAIEAADYLGWRTQAEDDASPNSGTMGMSGRDRPPIFLSKPRI
jgi:hypothetical protein